MAAINPLLASSAGMKRSRSDDGDDLRSDGAPFGKKVRPTLNAAGEVEPWHHDSVINTPTASSQQRKYDSDDQSSMVSEPGSPQDISISSGDDMDMDMDDSEIYSQSPEDHALPKSLPASSSPWRERMQTRNRVATPFAHTRPGVRPMQLRTGIKQHVRQRHPQENFSSDQLEVPSPIDEDEVPTPPSAAEAAGSQLSMLTVNDMDIETPEDLPAITVDTSRSLQLDGTDDGGTPGGLDAMDSSGPDHILVRKQRQRSGAQSNGSVSPARAGMDGDVGGMGSKRGFSMGFRADCEKCRMRVPGHMNHFIT